MAKLLVTGGAGFIGSHLVDFLLNKGNEVVILDNQSTGKHENINKEAKFVLGDIRSLGDLEIAFDGINGCFHLAAIASVIESTKNCVHTNQVNLAGTIEVFEKAAKSNIPIVYASSAAVYGKNPNTPFTEDALPLVESGYAADKYACELHARSFGVVKGLRSFGLRFFNVYGTRQPFSSDYSGVISIFHNLIKNGQDIEIYGDGNQVRDFINVVDVVRFLSEALKHASTEARVTNVCTGKATSVNEIADTLFKLLKPTNKVYLPERKGEAKISIGSPALAKEILGLESEIDLMEGIKIFLSN